MNDYIHTMFSVPLIHIQVREWKEKKNEIKRLYETQKINFDGAVKTDYHSQINSNFSYNKILEKLFKEELDELYKFINIRGKIISSWFETATKSNSHPTHHHGAIGYSAVCFVDYNQEEHTPTQFISPFNNFINGYMLHHSPDVSEGSLIFFPSTILHFTEPNKSNIDRTILSFNILFGS